MSHEFARPLNDNESAGLFLTSVLGYPSNEETGDIAICISEAEKLLASTKESTLKSKRNRHASYKDDETRKLLREKIFSELIGLERLEDDDEIKLGHGGAKPVGIEPKRERQAIFITGLPASGKSSVANRIADYYGAYILDSDYAKRKFPEYQSKTRPLQHVSGANVIHDESSMVIFGDDAYLDEPSLIQYCVIKEYNIIIPKIGYASESLKDLALRLQAQNYDLHLMLVSLDRVESTKRALARFLVTQRYVPLSLIFDGYANDPVLTYYREMSSSMWKTTGKISTNVERGISPQFVACSADENPAVLFK